MKYFKASITIENGQKKYGNLPIGFVLGYENSDLNEAYFCLYEQVTIPEDSDVTEIDRVEYDSAINIINQLANTKRQIELDETVQLIEEKNQKINSLELESAQTMNYVIDVDYRLSLVELGLNANN